MKILIIGGVAAGATAATRLKREMPNADIEIFERSSKISFSNCGLPYGISGEAKEELLRPEVQELPGIKVNVQHELIKIMEDDKQIVVRDLVNSETIIKDYDKLIIATGASALKLPIPGIEEENNLFTLRTFDDLVKIKTSIQGMKKAIVIGGGFAGVEIAESLTKMNIETSLVEMKPKLAGFDFDMSSWIEETLRENGVKLFLSKSVDKIDAKNKIATIGNENVEYDFIITTGIKPNTEFFKETSIEVDKFGLVETNNNSQTSNPDIYAAGDITYTNHIIDDIKVYMPMAKQAHIQGRAAADHIATGTEGRKFKTSGAMGLKLFGKTFAKAGFTEARTRHLNIPLRIVMATVDTRAKYANPDKMVMKMVFRSDNFKLLGLQAYGSAAQNVVDSFATALTAKMNIYDLEELNLIYQPLLSTTTHPLNVIAQVAINENRFGFTSECPYHVTFEEPEMNNLIIDVRSSAQHEKSHLKGSINIPTAELSIDTVGDDMDRSIVVACNSGFSASIAARKLKMLGYKNVRNAYGGNNVYQAMLKKGLHPE